MDLKLLEDLMALAQERSFVRAAEKRNVTHPAFGRRIKALEAWAGVTLVDRSHTPVQLTEAGQSLLSQARTVVQDLQQTRQRLRSVQTQGVQVLRLAAGRTLARTVVADWLSQMTRPRKPLSGARIDVRTGSMSDVAAMLIRDEVDLLCCYEHSKMSLNLNRQRFKHITLVHDKLVPVSRANAQGVAQHPLESGPVITYGPNLSLGALLAAHGHELMPDMALRTRYVCDSADAMQEYALRGLGLAWLPWSMVAGDCKRGALVVLGNRSDEVHFEVRLYRRAAPLHAAAEAAWAATNG